MKKIIIAIVCSVLSVSAANAQVSTVQDCLGAIPVCQNSYSTTSSFFGMGNYQNEIPWSGCLNLGGETNSVWYAFTVQDSGNLSFIITPNALADYDWGVFNLTNAHCYDLNYNFFNLLVSCNSSSDSGATGISSAMGGSGNFNDASSNNPFNQNLPVNTGETYVIMFSNWASDSSGYNINFSSSTATIFDNIPPRIDKITSTISPGDTTITFEFSEEINCSSIAPCDLSLTGPGGTYTINKITGACTGIGSTDKTYTITFSPPVSSTGNYVINLDATACNSVTDRCGNVAPSGNTGIKEITLMDNFSVYPNPAGSVIGIELKKPCKTGLCKVYDILGEEIISKSFTENKFNLDVRGLAKGLYLLKVESENAVAVKRFIKE